MVEKNPERRPIQLTPGEIKFHERVNSAVQIAQHMERSLHPDITPERLEELTKPRHSRSGEIGWGWYYHTTAEEKQVLGSVELEIENHRDIKDIPTGDVTLSVTRSAYTLDENHSISFGGLYWNQTVHKDEDATEAFQTAGEKLLQAWEDVKAIASNLPELARQQRIK